MAWPASPNHSDKANVALRKCDGYVELATRPIVSGEELLFYSDAEGLLRQYNDCRDARA